MRQKIFCTIVLIAFFISCQREISFLSTNSAGLQLVGSPNACSNTTPTGLFQKGTALTASNKISIGVNVTNPGQWTASTNTLNGISFSGNGNLTSTGNQIIVLQGSGTPLHGGIYNFNLVVGSQQCSFSLSVDSTTTTGGNIPPISSAGTDQSISLPTNSVTLSGSGSDADGTIVAYSWSKISGPASFNFAAANQASTQVNNLSQGSYSFELKVTDNLGATGRDTVIVSVGAAPSGSAGSFALEQKIFGTVTPVGCQAVYDGSGKIARLNSSYYPERTISYNSNGKILTVGWWFSGSSAPYMELKDSFAYDASGNVTNIIQTDYFQMKTYTFATFTYNPDNSLKRRKLYHDDGSVMEDNAFIYTNGNITGFINNAGNPQPGDTTIVTYDSRINNFRAIYPQMYFLDIQTSIDQTYRSEIYFFSNNYPTSFGGNSINVRLDGTTGKPFEVSYLGSVWYRYYYN